MLWRAYGGGGDYAVVDIEPQGDHQLAGERHDGNVLDEALEIAD